LTFEIRDEIARTSDPGIMERCLRRIQDVDLREAIEEGLDGQETAHNTLGITETSVTSVSCLVYRSRQQSSQEAQSTDGTNDSCETSASQFEILRHGVLQAICTTERSYNNAVRREAQRLRPDRGEGSTLIKAAV